MRITIKSFRSNENLRMLDPDIRQCYFEEERDLKFFEKYSKHHCDLECLSEDISFSKSCQTIEMLRRKNSTEKFCDGIYIESYPSNFEETRKNCKCLSNCNYLQYVIRTDVSKNRQPDEK